MPIYEYLCQECHQQYEKIVLDRGQSQVTCPRCASPNQTLQFSIFGTPKSSPGRSAGDGASCGCTPSSCGCSEKR